ncbi:LTA synthase family protein [Thermomonas haemolytica]|uniref:Phosphoglycerol transferase MdoB-like AlkP superfamily enzyme n=1 Tax=Thermomonas haemolytica TaxID=141949 RepID=A0A4R3N9H5_9GAMM|nr:LTA synthase family protein [Thermomonas haemolytica]TCT25395.1 phosphoglycerol transferase MdoB-like AlkP superfamily enzyme [Thermomonas haemolytica]
MRRDNAPRPADDGREGAGARLLAWLPALLVAQLVLALWAGARALPPGAGVAAWALAVAGQLLFLLRALPLLLPASLALAALPARRWALLGVGACWALFLLAQALLEQYFLTAGVALGADLFGYRLEEIRTTLGGAGGELGLIGAVGLLLPLLVLAVLLAWRARRPRPARRGVLAVLVLAGLAAWALPLAPGVSLLRGEAVRAAATSKGAYFVADSLRWWRARDIPAIASASAAAPTATVAAGGDPAYPFLHADATPDALGAYFGPTRDGRPPNVVVIVVEGLGRSFSGPEAALGSFTPFLDELVGRSLYFDNFLANQGRTFGVLPSLLASLPMAEQGFTALGADMPAHAGLFNVLQRQGYHTAFYSGTNLDFDDERIFLQRQGVQDIVDLRTFGAGYQRNPFDAWGYPDRELVARVLADSPRLQAPFVLGMQTISMHTNYRFPGQEAYRARLEQRLQQLGIPEARRAAYRAQSDIFTAILYTDDQLRRYFEGVAGAPWYADTVFVITGDHRLPEIPMDTHIERYHVPLLVFSPLLRQPARVRAVSSHLDVTPSLLALLAHTYGLKRPARAAWTGSGLDMATTFRSTHEFPLKQTKTSALDFVSGRWFLHDSTLFELQDGLRTSEVDDADLRAQVQARLQAYEAANAAFLRSRRLSPEGAVPALVAWREAPAAAPQAVQAAAPGLGVEALAVAVAADGIHLQAGFANGDGHDSTRFVPLAVLTTEDGRELHESYGPALRLPAQGQQRVSLVLPRPAAPGRYFVSVRPSDPDTGKPLGRGRYHVPVDIAGATQ